MTPGCEWCGGSLEGLRSDARFCGVKHRQASWRFGIRRCELGPDGRPMRFAYADPPYPGKAGIYPERREVDHQELVDRLVATYPDGWALSTSSVALAGVLGLCPAGVRVGAWLKSPRRVRSRRAHQAWEPVIFHGGRPLPVDVVHDVEDAIVARGRFRAFPGAIVGMKPPAFAEWVFRMLGARPGDELDDLYPGSGAVTLAWQRYAGIRRCDPRDASLLDRAA